MYQIAAGEINTILFVLFVEGDPVSTVQQSYRTRVAPILTPLPKPSPKPPSYEVNERKGRLSFEGCQESMGRELAEKKIHIPKGIQI